MHDISVVSFDYGRTAPTRFLFSARIGLRVSQRRIDSATSVNGHPITTGNYIYKDQKEKICGKGEF